MSTVRKLGAHSEFDTTLGPIDDLDPAVLIIDGSDHVLSVNRRCSDLLEAWPGQLPGTSILQVLQSAALPRLLTAARLDAGSSGSASVWTLAGRKFICRARRSSGPPGSLTLTLVAGPDADGQLAQTELAHRMRNSLQMIASLVAAYEREGSSAGYAAIRSHLFGVAALYDVMGQAGRGGAVRADLLLGRLADALRQSLLAPGSAVVLRVEAEPLFLAAEQAGPVSVIVNELVTNSLKHAFGDGGGEITLRAYRAGGEVTIAVADSGAGDAEDAKPSVGSRCVAGMVRQLRGQLERERSGRGFQVSVNFPDWAGEPPVRRSSLRPVS